SKCFSETLRVFRFPRAGCLAEHFWLFMGMETLSFPSPPVPLPYRNRHQLILAQQIQPGPVNKWFRRLMFDLFGD
ncbi:hypothetical protein, partial [Pseudomonas simiae]|uniref:hypothetical protein n=1 Tax=Pseudomonas simiae TaxID=321846 RepID=UPI001F3C4B3C